VALPPGAQEISVTVEEREAIERVSHHPPAFVCLSSTDHASSAVPSWL
jgi:hypothetical protein